MILKLKRTPGLYLAGSTELVRRETGLRVASELGWKFVEVSAAGPEELHAHVRTVQRGRPLVVALADALLEPRCCERIAELIQENGVSIWLSTGANDTKPIEADYLVDASSGAEEAARAILDLPIF